MVKIISSLADEGKCWIFGCLLQLLTFTLCRHHGFSLSRPSDGTRARSELKIITVTIITTIRAPVSMLVLFTFPSFFLSFLGSNPWPV